MYMKDTCGKHHEGAYFLRHKHFSFHESCLATSLTNYFFIVPAVNCIHAYTSQLNQQLLFHCYIFLQRNLRDGLKKQIHIYIAANTITFSPLLTRLFDVIMGLPALEAIFNLLSQKTWIFKVKFSIFKSSRRFLLLIFTKTITIKLRTLHITLRKRFLSTIKHQIILYYYIHTGIHIIHIL